MVLRTDNEELKLSAGYYTVGGIAAQFEGKEFAKNLSYNADDPIHVPNIVDNIVVSVGNGFQELGNYTKLPLLEDYYEAKTNSETLQQVRVSSRPARQVEKDFFSNFGGPEVTTISTASKYNPKVYKNDADTLLQSLRMTAINDQKRRDYHIAENSRNAPQGLAERPRPFIL